MKRALSAIVLAGILWLNACAVPAWVNTVEADAQVAIPIAASLVDVIDPALAPAATLVENGFDALVKALDTYKASPNATNLQAVQSAFAAINANVAQLESAAQIKNPKTASTAAAVVQLLTQAVTEIAALVPANSGLATRDSGLGKPSTESRIQNSEAHTAKGWKAGDFKKAFNEIAQQDPRLKEIK